MDAFLPNRSNFRTCTEGLEFKPGVRMSQGGNISKIGLSNFSRCDSAARGVLQLEKLTLFGLRDNYSYSVNAVELAFAVRGAEESPTVRPTYQKMA